MRCRAAAVAMLCLVLGACGKPDFDERYADREKELADEASTLEAELEQRMTEKPGLEAAPVAGGTDGTKSATE